MFRPHSASYECARRLIAVGCPLDYVNDLPRDISSFRKALHITQLEGYGDSCVFHLGNEHLGYVIPLRVGSDVPNGVIISDWSFSPPWDHHIDWDYDPRDVIPVSAHPAYVDLFDSRLLGVLNERRLLTRGHPVEGVLCGMAHFQSTLEPFETGALATAKISLTDDRGMTVQKNLRLRIDRSFAKERARVEQRPITR